MVCMCTYLLKRRKLKVLVIILKFVLLVSGKMEEVLVKVGGGLCKKKHNETYEII